MFQFPSSGLIGSLYHISHHPPERFIFLQTLWLVWGCCVHPLSVFCFSFLRWLVCYGNGQNCLLYMLLNFWTTVSLTLMSAPSPSAASGTCGGWHCLYNQHLHKKKSSRDVCTGSVMHMCQNQRKKHLTINICRDIQISTCRYFKVK